MSETKTRTIEEIREALINENVCRQQSTCALAEIIWGALDELSDSRKAIAAAMELARRWGEEAERGRAWEESQRRDGDIEAARLNQQRAGVREQCVRELRRALSQKEETE